MPILWVRNEPDANPQKEILRDYTSRLRSHPLSIVQNPLIVTDPASEEAINVILDEQQYRARVRLANIQRLRESAHKAEKRLELVGIPENQRPGAVYDYQYEGPASSYNAPMDGPAYRLQRLAEGWHLVYFRRKRIGSNSITHADLWLTSAQQAIAKGAHFQAFQMCEERPGKLIPGEVDPDLAERAEAALEGASVPFSRRAGARFADGDVVVVRRKSASYIPCDGRSLAKQLWEYREPVGEAAGTQRDPGASQPLVSSVDVRPEGVLPARLS